MGSHGRRSRVRRWVPAAGSGVAAAAVAGWSRAGKFVGNPRMIDGHYYLYGHDKMTEVTRDKYLQVANSNSLLGLAAALLFTAIALAGLIGWEPDRSS